MIRRWTATISLAMLLTACAAANNQRAETLDVPTATGVLAAQIPKALPFFRFVNDMADTDDPSEIGVYKALARHGLLQAYTAPSLLQTAWETHYRLTAKGAALVPGWYKAESGVYEVPVGTLRLVEVTGVQMLSPRHAMVTYTYVLELNAMGQRLRASSESSLKYFDPLKSAPRDIRAAAVPASDAAEMTLYEEGWKSESWSL